MTAFSIDDVRETMPREVRAFLGSIESAAGAFLKAYDNFADAEPESARLLNSVRHCGHAIYGTSSLVSAKTLAGCADLVERLAERGHAELIEAETRMRRARQVVDLLPKGVEQMRLVLDLALSHEDEAAEAAAYAWQNDAQHLLSRLQAAPQRLHAPSLYPDADIADDESELHNVEGNADDRLLARLSEPAEFSFDDVDAPAPSTEAVPRGLTSAPRAFHAVEVVATPTLAWLTSTEEVHEESPFSFDDDTEGESLIAQAEVQAELREIFQEEAREAVVALQGYFNALTTDFQTTESLQRIERVYHTLKGAAATIGLLDVSTLAQDLQLLTEQLAIAGAAISGQVLGELVARTNALFERAGLNAVRVAVPVTISVGPLSGGSPTPPAMPEFLDEAREIYEQACTLVAELSTPTGGKFTQSILVTLASLFHRLTGSARLAARGHAAELAATLEDACERETRPTTAELSLGLARIASNLALVVSTSSPELPSDARFASATRAAFEREAGELVDKALRIARELRTQGSTRDAGIERTEQTERTELGRLFHHLSGSARIAGNSLVADEARSLEDAVRHSTSDSDLQTAIDRLMILRARFSTDNPLKSSRPASIREPVEFIQIEELWETFTVECVELLEAIERATFALEDNRTPHESLKTLMRLVHTLKGVVNTIGLAPTGRTLHRVEDLLEMLLGATSMPPMRNVASLLIEVQAEVRRNLRQAPNGYVETSIERLETRIASIYIASAPPEYSERSNGAHSEGATGHLIPVSAGNVASGDDNDRRVIRVSTDRLDSLMNLAGELVVSRSRLASRVERLRTLQRDLVRGGRRLLDTVDDFREEHEFANLDGKRRWSPAGERVSAQRDDVAGRPIAWGTFSDLELDRYEGIHILTRSLAELTSDFSELHGELLRGLSALNDDADVVGGIVSGIQSEVTHARMVPLDLLFMRLRLPLRDAAYRERKEVRVVVSGQDVPVDKSIADALFQPLLHLVRNAVVHGIEAEEIRTKRGKDSFGVIALSARQESGQIVIEVRDDGGGLDREALRTKGVQLGALSPEVSADDPRVAEMVFVEGLSTQQDVGQVAGRGVGGNVVKRAVDRLNGSILVQSAARQGTTFTIRLPLTLAITRALVVGDGEQSFAIPLHFAERIIDAHEKDIAHLGRERRIKLDDVFVPIRTLGELFERETSESDGPVLILRVGDSRIAIQVNSIVAHEEVVVKSMGTLLGGHPYFSGITIRGTGDLVLILDVPNLVQVAGSTFLKAPVPPEQVATDVDPREKPASSSRQPAALSRANARTKSARVSVLFVDDSVSVRKVAEMQLRELGADVVTAVDGVDAVAKLREHSVDIVFTDLEMPRMHGYELIRELRFIPAYKDLPIVVVTSRSGRKHQDQARELGASEYLTKPFTAQQLDVTIRKFVRNATEHASMQENVEGPLP